MPRELIFLKGILIINKKTSPFIFTEIYYFPYAYNISEMTLQSFWEL